MSSSVVNKTGFDLCVRGSFRGDEDAHKADKAQGKKAFDRGVSSLHLLSNFNLKYPHSTTTFSKEQEVKSSLPVAKVHLYASGDGTKTPKEIFFSLATACKLGSCTGPKPFGVTGPAPSVLSSVQGTNLLGITFTAFTCQGSSVSIGSGELFWGHCRSPEPVTLCR